MSTEIKKLLSEMDEGEVSAVVIIGWFLHRQGCCFNLFT